jgi:hypothetical protein
MAPNVSAAGMSAVHGAVSTPLYSTRSPRLMSEPQCPIYEPAAALRAYGCKVEPWRRGYPLWLVDGETLTDGELMALALRLGLMDSTTTRLQ